MKVLQTYYTSCRVGQSNASGFQFYSYSDGLTQDELWEIEKLGNYIPPINLPSNPTPAEIEELFPVSFCYFKLKSGRVGALQSVALTQDYSGRPGNFFCHAFILDSGEFSFLPIELYQSTSFRNNLTQAEWDVSTAPDKLPVIELSDLGRRSLSDLRPISDFLSQENNETTLGLLVNSVIESAETRRKIILADTPESIVFWLTSVSLAFPLHLANGITFSTYSHDPANNKSLICGTVNEGSRFNFRDEAAYKFQYYIFNRTIGKYSAVNSSSNYAELANIALTISYEKFSAFHEFFKNFNYCEITRKIDTVYNVFQVSQDGAIFYPDWAEQLKFIEENAKEDYLRRYIHDNNIFLDHVLDGVFLQHEDVEIFFALLLTVIRKTKNAQDFDMVLDLYLSWVHMFIFCEKGETESAEYLQTFLRTNASILSRFLDFKNDFCSSYFREETFSNIESYLAEVDISSFFTYTLGSIFQTASICQITVDQLFAFTAFDNIVKQYIKLLSGKGGAIPLFASLDNSQAYFDVLRRFTPFIDRNTLLATVESADKNILKASEVLALAKADLNINLVADLSPYLLKNVENQQVSFWEMAEFLKSRRAVNDKYSILIESYLNSTRLDQVELIKLVSFTIETGCILVLPRLMEEVEAGMKIDDVNSKEQIKFITYILSIKQKYKTQTKNSIAELYNLLIGLDQKKYTNVLNVLKGVTVDPEGMSRDKLDYFLSKMFPYLISLVTKEKDYFYIFIFISKLEKTNALAYFKSGFLGYADKNNNREVDICKLLVNFYFNLKEYKAESDDVEKIVTEQLIMELVAELSKSKMERLNSAFVKKKNGDEKKWDILIQKINQLKAAKSQGSFKNIFSIFKK